MVSDGRRLGQHSIIGIPRLVSAHELSLLHSGDSSAACKGDERHPSIEGKRWKFPHFHYVIVLHAQAALPRCSEVAPYSMLPGLLAPAEQPSASTTELCNHSAQT